MSKPNDDVDSSTSSLISIIISNYWNDVKNSIYSAQDHQVSNEIFKELLNRIELNEATIFKFEEAHEAFYTCLVAYCSIRICSDIDSCKYKKHWTKQKLLI